MKVIAIQELCKRELKKANDGRGYETYSFIMNLEAWELPPVEVELNISDLNLNGAAGLYLNNPVGIQARWFGRYLNDENHRGGLIGTILHELSHYISDMATYDSNSDWYWDSQNDLQTQLWERYKGQWGTAYASSCPKEATAEAFRVIHGRVASVDREWVTIDGMHQYLSFFKRDKFYSKCLPPLGEIETLQRVFDKLHKKNL